MSVIGIGNGTFEASEPTNAREAADQLTGKPLTLGYRPSLPASTFWDRNGAYVTSMITDIEAMLLHPHVQLPYSYYKAGIANAEFEVKASSRELGVYIESLYHRVWERSLEAIQNSYDYGWNGYETVYAWESGRLVFDSLLDFYPMDCWVLTENREYRGLTVQNVQGAKGKIRLWGPGHWPAKGFWFAHRRRFHRWYGRSQLYGAWRPWRRLAYRDGAEEVIDMAAYRFGVKGPLVRYPPEEYRKRNAQSGVPSSRDEIDYGSAQAHAREIAENLKAGMSSAFPNTRDAKGEYKWVLEWPESTLDLTGLLDIGHAHQKEIAWGVETPPELLEASETGSGWSGRMVPLLGFYVGQTKNARNVMFSVKEQIGDPLAKWNFGPKAHYTVEVHLRLPKDLSEKDVQQAAAAGGAGKGGGGDTPNTGEKPQPVLFSTNGRPAYSLANANADGSPVAQPQQQEQQAPQGQQPKPGQPASAPAPEKSVESWRKIVQDDAVHARIIGNSGSGKSTVAQALAVSMPGSIFIIDPLWKRGNWGGLPAVTIDDAGGYSNIELAIHGLMGEMKRRWKMVQDGGKELPRLTIIWDEIPDTVAELGEVAGELIRRLAQRGRHSNMHLIGIAQSDRVQAWGLQNFGDASQNFATIYLGNKAIEKMPALAGDERPGVLDFEGKEIPISLKGVLEESKKPIGADRAYQLPGVPMVGGSQQAPQQLGGFQEDVNDSADLATTAPASKEQGGGNLSTVNLSTVADVASRYVVRIIPDATLMPRPTAPDNLASLSTPRAGGGNAGVGGTSQILPLPNLQVNFPEQKPAVVNVPAPVIPPVDLQPIADAMAGALREGASQMATQIAESNARHAEELRDMTSRNAEQLQAIRDFAEKLANRLEPKVAQVMLSTPKPEQKAPKHLVVVRDSDGLITDIIEDKQP